MMRPVAVLRTATRFPMDSHRTDFETCPHCSKVVSFERWTEQTTAVTLAPVGGSVLKYATLSECPKCGEDSWVHQEATFYRMHSRPFVSSVHEARWKKAAEAVAAEEKARNIAAARAWATGLCGRCKNLAEATLGSHAWRLCSIGSGRVRAECDEFEKTVPDDSV